MKTNKKLILGLLTLTLLNACKTTEQEPLKDCSAIFETRDALNNPLTQKKDLSAIVDSQYMGDQPPTECKVLEVKLDKGNKCEFVGSDKIDDFAKLLEKNQRDQIILIVPKDKFADLAKLAEQYLPSTSALSIKNHFDSEIFKNFNFPYRGLRCSVNGKKIVLWSGQKQVILTVKN